MSGATKTTRRGLVIAAVGGAAVIAALPFLGQPGGEATTATPGERATALGRRHGVTIDIGNPADLRLDGESGPPFAGAKTSAAALEALGPALDGIAAALACFPDGFAGRLVRAIAIAGRVEIDGRRVGGANGRAAIAIAAPAELEPAAIRETCRLVLLDHLAGHVWRRNPVTAAAWAEAMPAGWRAATAEETIAAERTPPPRSDSGFLTAYGATSLEADFRSHAVRMAADPAGLASLALRYRATRRKAEIVRAAFVAIDGRCDATLPRFDRA